jgi:hypothetical protein
MLTSPNARKFMSIAKYATAERALRGGGDEVVATARLTSSRRNFAYRRALPAQRRLRSLTTGFNATHFTPAPAYYAFGRE